MKQYAASPVIQRLISDRATYFPVSWQQQFYDGVWNVDTAAGFGLDVWGKIVVVSRDVQIDVISTTFGFYEAWSGDSPSPPEPGPVVINGMTFVLSVIDVPPVTGDDRVQPFDQAPFYDGILATQTVTLADDAYRRLIYAKALANISDCSTPSINKVLNLLFGGPGKRCYVQTNNKMDMSFVFEFQLSPVEKTIALQSGIMPRPAGVKLTIVQADPSGTFGFSEGGWQPFDNGVFFGDDGVINAI